MSESLESEQDSWSGQGSDTEPTDGDNTRLKFSLRWDSDKKRFYLYVKDFTETYRVALEHKEWVITDTGN